jgi:flagellar hook-associated protein 1
VNGEPSDNGLALAIAGMGDQPVGELGGLSIRDSWLESASSIGIRTGAARTRADAAGLVRGNLEAQRAAVSGVSVDEESINMLNYQRQYQGAARFITVIDELTQTLLSLI